jgi:hypothetical protein
MICLKVCMNQDFSPHLILSGQIIEASSKDMFFAIAVPQTYI